MHPWGLSTSLVPTSLHIPGPLCSWYAPWRLEYNLVPQPAWSSILQSALSVAWCPPRSLLGESWLLHVGFCGKRTQRWGSALGCCEGGLWGSQPWTGRRPDPWPSLDQHIPSRHCWTLTSPASLQPLLPCPLCIHPFQLRRGTKQVAEEEPRNGTGETVRETLKKNAVCHNISYKRGNRGESQYLTEWGCNWDTYIWKNVSHLKTLWRLFIIIQNIC